MAERLPVGRPAVSKHLRVLSKAGLVEHSSVGTRNRYALAPGRAGGGAAVAGRDLGRGARVAGGLLRVTVRPWQVMMSRSG